MYPYREDYPCSYCKKGTMKWRGELFASTYQLGRSYCTNPDCLESFEMRNNFIKFIEKVDKDIADDGKSDK